jgi:NADP-dependent 3-hydroxy acid dehydrogenase YdfG
MKSFVTMKAMETNNNLAGKVVVITGASSGIGEATARLLASQGAQVVLGARRTEQLAVVVEEILQAGGQAVFQATDVRNPADLESLAALAITQFGRLDVMINNAGVAQLGLMEDLDLTGWEDMIAINLKGTLYGIAAAIPFFKAQGSGHIINIISTAGIKITPMMGVYAGTKNAVRTITEALRQESKGRWRVTGISPGFVNTPFSGKIKNDALRTSMQTQAQEIAIPAEAIAAAVAYAIAQPEQVDVGDMVIRPAIQD